MTESEEVDSATETESIKKWALALLELQLW